jgi:hypothetical protein
MKTAALGSVVVMPAPGKRTTPALPVNRSARLDDEALRCIKATAERTGVDEGDLLSCIVKEWYRDNFDVPPGT